MGMDLQPINPAPNAPKDDYGVQWGRYNWAGWELLHRYLTEWKVNTKQLAGSNDGDIINEATCEAIADAIETHLSELPDDERNWLQPHIALWRTCGGYRQL